MGARREALERIGQLSLTGDNRSGNKSEPANRNTKIAAIPAPEPVVSAPVATAATANVHRIDRAMRGLAPLPLDRESVALAEAWVETALEHAARTAKLMLGGKYDRPAGLRSGWPSDVFDPWDYPDEKTTVTRELPSSSDIDDMDRIVPWLNWIESDRIRTIVWRRASGVPVARLQKRLGIASRDYIRRLQRQGFAIILANLTGHSVETLRTILK